MGTGSPIKSGKFPNRTSMAIQNAVKRLSFDNQKKNFVDSQIREAKGVAVLSVVVVCRCGDNDNCQFPSNS
ncbi:MAG: hypothetical protein OEY95_02055 [Candidatus Bathyarchaeota archaeon]|nr:hypothetical protein [Candidatus Bathyarchaeota archaeon]